MKLSVIEIEEGHTTVVNTEQITYLREDVYGTAIHFSSGEHVICAMGIESLMLKLQDNAAEALLIRSKV
ncbi:hypothetical protein [Novosphingobium sp.]|uniref:hypothetical protein n=1 Tax=Novosphingobium sp. TaxID=1874826 RepID=UPI00286C9E87|nr:hypothetical protein [Novosphingobium sp.]